MRNGNKIIRGKALEDQIGQYIPYCTFEIHEGIVRYSQYKICEKRDCEHYIKFRPEKGEDIRG